ncbi:hypothetical protein I4U23_020715 [Adineta vaga]|nr:hypothetical protein I4U23_020715 [Adineta vaga]
MTDNKDQDSTYNELDQQRLLKLQQYIRLYLERKKYAPMVRNLTMILCLHIQDSTLTATKFDEAYNIIILSLDCEFSRLKQIFMNEESTELQQKFEQIHNEYENEKFKKSFGTEEQSKHLTSEHPKKYNIYRIRQSITTTFGLLSSIQSNTNTSHSSSSSSSQIEKNYVTFLAITRFSNKDPSIKGKNGVFPILDRTYLLKRLISIGSTRELPGQKSITAFKKSNIPSDLNGYLVLIPTVAAENVKWEDHYPYYFSQSDLMYINFRLAQLSKDIDIEDYSTSESSSSVPTSRLEFERIKDWMLNNKLEKT